MYIANASYISQMKREQQTTMTTRTQPSKRQRVVDGTIGFLQDLHQRGVRYECSQPELYDQFTVDAAEFINIMYQKDVGSNGTVVTHEPVSADDVRVAVEQSTQLNQHPALRRNNLRTSAAPTSRAFATAAASSSTIASTIVDMENGGVSRVSDSSDDDGHSVSATPSRSFRGATGGLGGSAPHEDVCAPPIPGDSLWRAAEQRHEGVHMSERERAIAHEATRVQRDVRDQLVAMLEDGTYMQYSNLVDKEYMACVVAKYPVATAFAVENEIRMSYTIESAHNHMNRPYLAHYTRYNVTEPLRKSQKRIFCTMFYFRFLNDPSIVMATAAAASSSRRRRNHRLADQP